MSCGSVSNIDETPVRSLIRRFDLSGKLELELECLLVRADLHHATAGFTPGTPLDFFASGILIADGLRNEVGLGFDSSGLLSTTPILLLFCDSRIQCSRLPGLLWGVENGADNLNRADIGGDIHNDNPAEELNSFPEANFGKFYGSHHCTLAT